MQMHTAVSLFVLANTVNIINLKVVPLACEKSDPTETASDFDWIWSYPSHSMDLEMCPTSNNSAELAHS